MAPSPSQRTRPHKSAPRTPPPKKERLDHLLVARGLAETRPQAQALILAGQVLVAGQKRDKAGAIVDAAAELRLLAAAASPYVSRGGCKLAAALDAFAMDPRGRVCVDVGASTGGFTDCLLQRGARRVYALDTGRGQLHWRLRQDPRVVLREKCNVRYLRPEDIPEPASLIAVDVSFISVTLLLPALVPLLAPRGGDMIILVKPQFEAGKGQVGKGGIVRDAAVRQAAVVRVRAAVAAAGGQFRQIGERKLDDGRRGEESRLDEGMPGDGKPDEAKPGGGTPGDGKPGEGRLGEGILDEAKLGEKMLIEGKARGIPSFAGVIPSPILGAEGNQEFLLAAHWPPAAG